MKLSLSGMTPSVIGELVNSLFPCVDRDVTSRWRAFVGSFMKAHAMTILSYTRFSLLMRLVRPLVFIHTLVHNDRFHSLAVSLKLLMSIQSKLSVINNCSTLQSLAVFLSF